MKSWTSRWYHPKELIQKVEDEPYDGPCPCCESMGNNWIIDKTSRQGIKVICRDCQAIWIVNETNAGRKCK